MSAAQTRKEALAALRNAKIPTDVWDFLNSNVPRFIVALLSQHIDELVKLNGLLLRDHADTMTAWDADRRRFNAIEDRLARLEGARIPTVRPKPKTEGRTEKPVTKRNYRR